MKEKDDSVRKTGEVLMLTSKGAAEYLGISGRHLTDLCGKREVAYYKIGRNRVFKVGDLEAYLRRCRVPAVGEGEWGRMAAHALAR